MGLSADGSINIKLSNFKTFNPSDGLITSNDHADTDERTYSDRLGFYQMQSIIQRCPN